MSFTDTLKEALNAFRAGDLALARDLCETILKQYPDDAGSLRILGQISYLEGDMEAAALQLEKSLRIKPEQYSIWIKLGNIYGDLADHTRATEAYTDAMKYTGDAHLAYFWRAQSQALVGKDEEVWADLGEAVRLNPTFGQAYRLMILLGYPGASEQAWEQDILGKLVNHRFPRDDAIQAHYALANYYEKDHQYKKMWHQLNSANGRQKNQAKPWADPYDHLIKRTKEVFTPAFLKTPRPPEKKKITPIFIVGLPRSGSTLLEQMVAAHGRIEGAGEAQIMTNLIGHIQSTMTLLIYPDGLEELGQDQLGELSDFYQERLKGMANGHAFATDKLLSNSFFVGLIYQLMPWAKVLHIKRDPLDNAFSIYKNYFWEQQNPEFCSLADIGGYARLTEDIMAHWRDVLPGFVHEVWYEDLVDAPEAALKKIIRFCGLPWDASCLQYRNQAKGAGTLSAAQVKKPLYKSSIGTAEKFKDQLQPFTEALKP